MSVDESELLLKKADYLISELKNSGYSQFVGFLSEDENEILTAHFFKRGVLFDSFGGIENAERKFLGIYKKDPPKRDEYPINVLKISLHKNSKKQSHRVYLGSILALGLDRRIIGDIVIDDTVAYVAVNNNFTNFLKTQLRRIGSENCISEEINNDLLITRKSEFSDITVSVASNRLDAIISELTSMSRENSKSFIIKGLVFINGVTVLSPIKEIKPGDRISVRKFGKFIFDSKQGNTKSGRLRLIFKKYM